MRLIESLRPASGGVPDWDRLLADHAWARAMYACPQDPTYHAEGDVWTHTRMVVEAMHALPAYQELGAGDQRVLDLAALLHDVGKPTTTREENGRLRSPGHSVRGEIIARRILWGEGVPFHVREAVCALIRFHQQPFHLLSKPDAQKRLFRISVVSRADHLALLAEADAMGRVCDDAGQSVAAAHLFREYAEEQGCLSHPFPFPSAHSRFLYFHKDERNPYYEAHDDTRGEVILMSGLPGTGKSTWIAEHAPADYELIGLDETREMMRISPTEDQGPVLQETKEQAKRIMGAKTSPRSFVWNATSISRQRRAPLIDLFTRYNYRTRIVYVEVPPAVQDRQNQDREKPVPAEAIDGMLRHWEVPDRSEAQRVDYYDRGA